MGLSFTSLAIVAAVPVIGLGWVEIPRLTAELDFLEREGLVLADDEFIRRRQAGEPVFPDLDAEPFGVTPHEIEFHRVTVGEYEAAMLASARAVPGLREDGRCWAPDPSSGG